MKFQDPTPILQRLLLVASESQAAFLEAAFAARSPRLTALFIRRAEHQRRITDYLSDYLTPGSGSEAVTSPPGQRSTTFSLPLPLTRPARDHEALLRACIRVLDTAILEFARAYTPAMSLTQRISLERHHDQMRWSREELVSLRRSYKPPPARIASAPQDGATAGNGDNVWFGTLCAVTVREE